MLNTKMELLKVEKGFQSNLSKIDYWGDIDLPKSEYDNLKILLSKYLSENYRRLEKLFDEFPISITTFFVFFSRYKYKNNFWGGINSELEINIPPQVEGLIGKRIRNIFNNFGFDFSEVKEETRVNIAPILFQAGLPPESSFNDLFYIIEDNINNLDPHQLIEDISENRYFGVNKPLTRFLKRFKDERALEFIIDVHESMLSVNQNFSNDSIYCGQYLEWKERNKDKERYRNYNSKSFMVPRLIFENGKRGLCIELPKMSLKNEWIDSVRWEIIIDNGNKIIKKMHIFDSYNRYIEKMIVPVNPSSTYIIKLIESDLVDELESQKFEILGIQSNQILMFNHNGYQTNSRNFDFPYMILITSGNAFIKSEHELIKVTQYYPNNIDGYTIYYLEPLSHKSFIEIQTEISNILLNPKPKLELELIGSTLLETNPIFGLYTDIPKLKIINEYSNINNLEIRIGDKKILLEEHTENNNLEINLDIFEREIFNHFGTYIIKLYQNNKYIKQIEFTKVPFIESNFNQDLINYYDPSFNIESLSFNKLHGWELVFEECNTTNVNDKLVVTVPQNRTILRGRIISVEQEFKINKNFELALKPIEVVLIDSQSELVSYISTNPFMTKMDEIVKNGYWFNIKQNKIEDIKSFSIKLSNKEGLIQEYKFNQSIKSKNINLNLFIDSINNNIFPQFVEMQVVFDKIIYKQKLVIISEKKNFTKKIKHYINSKNGNEYIVSDVDDGNFPIQINRFGAYKRKISLNNANPGKKLISYFYKLKETLNSGIYTIERESELDNELFIADENNEDLAIGNSTFYIPKYSNSTDQLSFSIWIDKILDIIVNELSFSTFKNYQESKNFIQSNKDKIVLDENDFENLVGLACILNSKLSLDIKTYVQQEINFINSVINIRERGRFIKFLVEANCSIELFKQCYEFYRLCFFEIDDEISDDLSERLYYYSPKLSLQLLMKKDCEIKKIISKEKYLELIGKESLLSMMNVSNNDKNFIQNEIRKFLNESKSEVKISIPKEVSGDFTEIKKMYNYDAKIPYIDMSKKPNTGLNFNNKRYLDLYLKWYCSNYDRQNNIKESVEKDIIRLIKGYAIYLVKYFNELKKDNGLRNIFKDFEKSMQFRYSGDPLQYLNSTKNDRFFYLIGIGCLLSSLPKENVYSLYRRVANNFLIDAMEIAPRLVDRDLFMTETYIYLKKKER